METGAAAPFAQPAAAPSAAPVVRASAPRRPLPRSGWAAFDALQLVRPRRVLLLDVGAPQAHDVVFRLLVDAVARAGEALVLDGGNWLDVYKLGDAADAMGRPRLATMQGVRVARGFTAYQLQSLIEDAFPREAAASGASLGLVLVSCFPEMYLDEDVKPDEARALATRAMSVCREVAAARDVPVVVTNGTVAPGYKHRLRAAMDEGAHETVGLLPAPHGALRIVTSRGATLAPAPGARQKRLDEYAPMPAPRGEEGAFYRRAIDARLRYLPKRVGEMEYMLRQKRPVVALD